MLTRLIMAAGLVLLASQSANALEQVSMQLKWKHQFQFAGYYAALEQGFYRDAGLDVTIREGGPGIDVAETVASGKADFGVCRMDAWSPAGRVGGHLPALAGRHPGSSPARHQQRIGFARPEAHGLARQR
jgi:ABC-type nitrate/sulfonate/bicarbonate transport system substrate-binding protein